MKDKIIEQQFEYDLKDSVDLNVEPEASGRQPNVFSANWMVDYFKRPNQERVIWQTKLYESKRQFEDKPLFEQVEELTDLSAKSFVMWLNELGQEKSEVTEEMVKKLFSIGIEEGVSKALKFGSKHVSAIPDAVASYWSLSDFGMEQNITKAKRQEQKYRSQKDRRVAFGSFLPMELRRKYELYEEPEIIPPIFQEIRTFKRIFKGITNLTYVCVC